MAVLVLGRPVVRVGGVAVRPVRRMARVLLGIFALRPNRELPVDWIVDGLWSGRPPASAGANVRSHIAELRRLLGNGRPSIETVDAGYMLAADPTNVDALRFEHLVREGRRRQGADAARCLTDAVELWRGRVLEGLQVPKIVRPQAAVLDDLRMSAIEELIDIRLALGHHRDLVPLLKGLVIEHPLRERLWHQLLLALRAAGRRGEVQDTYRRLSEVLDTELGVRPSAVTTELARHDQALSKDCAR